LTKCCSAEEGKVKRGVHKISCHYKGAANANSGKGGTSRVDGGKTTQKRLSRVYSRSVNAQCPKGRSRWVCHGEGGGAHGVHTMGVGVGKPARHGRR